MTAERVLIDARGGGFGHAMRGANLAALLHAEGHSSVVCVSPGSERYLTSGAAGRALAFEVRADGGVPSADEPFDTLVVDTFAEGTRGEWRPHELARFARRVLCARFRRDGLPRAAAGYDEVWLPYCEALDEWGSALPRARHLGLLARPAPMRVEPGGETWRVFDPGRRLDPHLRATFARLARAVSRPLVFHEAMEGRFEAAKLLCVGAGYNTVYELLRRPGDVRFLPLARRFDDQERRARRVERAVSTLEALRDWLMTPCAPAALPDAWYADACGRPSIEHAA